ncbi:hypothetical protein TSAR_011987 [Trichomalopsis sarcophagae]|uniref:Uncharacterized protein n=1 Tax=Trichomalopsis sarcophagae TaxID=543379 RepID=A0A232EZ89_9HYME|nr:hypothetical protein TSAR_011987 [Trichomalopsis sarcophagae]
MAQTGYLTPQAFMYFDRRGYIQNDTNVPILYHHSRHQSNKTITFDPNNPSLKYSTTMPAIDNKINHRINKKYYWLVDDGKFHDEVRRRKTIHISFLKASYRGKHVASHHAKLPKPYT